MCQNCTPSLALARTVEEIITLEDRYADSRASSFTLGSAQRGDGRGATGSPKPLEATRIAQALGNGKAVILRNHVSPLLSGSDNGASSYDTQSTRNEAHRWGAARVQSIQQNGALLTSLPELIDRETGVREIFEILQSIIAQAGDLIESRGPELVAAARAALTRYNDEALGEAE